MWDEYTTEEKLEFLTELSGVSRSYPIIDHELAFLAEAALNHKQRMIYVDHMSGTIADHTYRRIDPEHPDAALHYYYNMMHAETDLRVKMIWCAVTGNQP